VTLPASPLSLIFRFCALAHHAILLQRKIRSRSVSLGHGLRGAVTLVSSDQPFFDPIELPDGRELVTLRDAVPPMRERSSSPMRERSSSQGGHKGRDNSLLQPSISMCDRPAAHRAAGALAT
jgi:hypothetical protein